MNKNTYRIVFNAARGTLMVVQEIARSAGKAPGTRTATAGLATAALTFGIGLAQAQVVADPNAPGNQRPTVLTAPNGTPLVNIQTPSAAGVSRNVYRQFDVQGNGVILNNSRTNTQTQLGGWVQGNPWLATGGARVILNEVNSSNPSQLRGYVEVAGQRAEVIIANPAGIQVDGGGFINASRATLTTGTPQLNALGDIDGFRVSGGTISIDGRGLDLSQTDYAGIYARALQVNAGIWAKELQIVTGANQVGVEQGGITPIAGTGNAPAFALDVAALGGMYAGKITLIGTEAGLGVRNAGTIQAVSDGQALGGVGQLVVTSAGRLENTGTMQAQAGAQIAATGVANAGTITSGGSLQVTSQDDLANHGGLLEGTRLELSSAHGNIDNREGTLRQTSLASLSIDAQRLSNTRGGVLGAEPEPAGNGSGESGGGETNPPNGGTTHPGTGTGGGSGGSGNAGGTGGGSGAGNGGTPSVQPPTPGLITGRQILNDGGRIEAGVPIDLHTPEIDNTGGTLSVANLSVTGSTFSNAGGTLNISQNFQANVGQFDNTSGTLNAGQLGITTTGDLLNQDGTLASNGDAALTVGGAAHNQRGAISAAGVLNATVSGALDNTAGTLAANQGLGIAAQSLDNSDGSIQSTQAATQLVVGQALRNINGNIGAATDLSVQAGSVANTGNLRAGQDASLAVTGTLANDGGITAGRHVTVNASSLQGGAESVLGAGLRSDGTLGAAGDLRVTTSGALVAHGTQLAAGDATLQGSSIDLSGGQTGAQNIALAATQGHIDTSRTGIVTPGTLSVTANSQAGQTLVNRGGQLNAGQLAIHVSNLDNTQGGEIVQTGTAATTIATTGTLDNSSGRISVNAQDLTLQASHIANTDGAIEHAGTGTLELAAGSYSGANGEIISNGTLNAIITGDMNQDGGTTSAQRISISAGSLSNQGGRIVQTGTDDTRIHVRGAFNNNAGTLASNGYTALTAGSLANQSGSIRAAGTADLTLSVQGALDNRNGELNAGGGLDLVAGSLDNDSGRITALERLTSTTAGATTNRGGTLAANADVELDAGSLANDGGQIGATEGDLRVTTTGATSNVGGSLVAAGATTLSNAGLDNSSGKVFGSRLDIDTRGQQLTNDGGTLAATGAVNIVSGALNNDAGLIQSGDALTLNTQGQALINTHAAGHASGQGGIASGAALTLTTGTLDNTAGFIGAADTLTATTGAFTNAQGGTLLSQADASIDTQGQSFDNRGGQTLAVGNLAIRAGSIDNSTALIRSAGTITLNAGSVINTNTLGADQGIEGEQVNITTGYLANNSGAIRSNEVDGHTTITSSGTVDNSGGLISAGDTVRIADPNAGGKTLNLVNTGGTVVANKSVQVDAARFSADGTLSSGRDLSLALTQDVVNNANVSAVGDLSYVTTGNFTNNGTLVAGQTLTVGGNTVGNNAGAEMSGTDTRIYAGTLNNRGLIDSNGETQINAGVVNNIGTGRIYGDWISIGAGTLNNDFEAGLGATIAARSTLDIGASSINNRDGSLIFSAGDIFIGGALDGDRMATGQGGTLNNLSASIESLGSMSIAMGTVNNLDTHLRIERTSSTSTNTYIATLDGRTWDPADTWGDPATRLVYHRDADGNVSVVGLGWTVITDTTTVDKDEARDQAPATIVAGGDLHVEGHLYNRDSKVIAGGDLTATTSRNEATPGNLTSTTTSVLLGYNPNRPGRPPELPIVMGPTTTSYDIAVGGYEWSPNTNAAVDRTPGASGRTGTGGGASGKGNVNASNRGGTFIEVPANVGEVVRTSGTGADAATGANGEQGTHASQTIPVVVRSRTPDTTLPTASLFRTLPGSTSRYLIETDPRFANYRNWLSSDYLLNSLGLDPNNTLKRLGDGFYEQKLIREQIAQLTGYRYLDGFQSDEAQYTALMNAGATFAKEYHLTPGIALTAEQMAQLTSDIVWLVEQTVTLPDGSTERVLVPQVYVRVRPGDIDGSGALLSADRIKIDNTSADFTNSGTVAGRTLVDIKADNINNLGGRISGGNVKLDAQTDINNIGGTIDARDALSLVAGRDVNVRTTTQTNGANTNIDRVAGLYVTNPGGTLVVNAGRDVNLTGATVANTGRGGLTSIKAGNDINLGTVTETRSVSGSSAQASLSASSSRELGTTIATDGTTLLNAGRDLNARQATVDAGSGFLSVHADRDINIESGQSRDSGSYSAQWTDKGTFSRTENQVNSSYDNRTSIGSSFSGNVVVMSAGNDINIEGSHISGTQGVLVDAGRNLNIVEGRNTTSSSTSLEKETTGVSGIGGVLLGQPSPVVPYSKESQAGLQIQTNTASASTITSTEGGVLLQGGGNVFMQGVQVDAAKDITINGNNVVIQAALDSRSVTGTASGDKKGITANEVLWHDPSTGINARKTTETTLYDTGLARTTLNGANVSITAKDTLAMAGTTVNTPGQLSLNADTLLLGTQSSEHSTQETSQGRDLAYQKFKDKGSQDQTTEYNQFNVGSLEVNANHVQAGLGARDSVEQLAQMPGMGWVQQINSDPNLAGKIDWQRVEEAHKNWNHDQQGLTPEGAAIVTIVVAWATWGTASELGVAAGDAAGASYAGGTVATLGEGGFIAGGGVTVSTVVGGAVTAGISALAGQAAVALINNQGDIGKALDDLGSSANVKNLLTAIVTGGVLGGLNMNPTGLPTTGAGADQFMTQLGNNLTAGAAKAVISTAINGGSLEEALKDGLKAALLDTVAATGANWIGDNTDGFVNKVAHAMAGCAVGAARQSDGCAAGALGAAIGEMAAEGYGRSSDTVQFAAMISGIAAAIAGGNAADIQLASQSGANAAANNYLKHAELQQKKAELAACTTAECKKDVEAKWDQVSQDRNTQMRDSCVDGSTQQCQKNIEELRADLAELTGNGSGTGLNRYTPEESANIKQAQDKYAINLEVLAARGNKALGMTYASPEQLQVAGYLTKQEAEDLKAIRGGTFWTVLTASCGAALAGSAKSVSASQAASEGVVSTRVRVAGSNVEVIERDGTVLRLNSATGIYEPVPALPMTTAGAGVPAATGKAGSVVAVTRDGSGQSVAVIMAGDAYSWGPTDPNNLIGSQGAAHELASRQYIQDNYQPVAMVESRLDNGNGFDTSYITKNADGSYQLVITESKSGGGRLTAFGEGARGEAQLNTNLAELRSAIVLDESMPFAAKQAALAQIDERTFQTQLFVGPGSNVSQMQLDLLRDATKGGVNPVNSVVVLPKKN